MSRITQTELSEIKQFNYIKYSTATTYKNKCLAAHKPIPSRLLQVLMGYVNDSFVSIDSKVFNKIIDDIELREINLFKLTSELKNQFPNNPKNLSRIIFRINECYYDVLLKKITDIIDQNTDSSKMDWYLSKADFNGLPLKCLIHHIKCYIKNNSKLSSEEIENYNTSLDSHLHYISSEFRNNGYSLEIGDNKLLNNLSGDAVSYNQEY